VNDTSPLLPELLRRHLVLDRRAQPPWSPPPTTCSSWRPRGRDETRRASWPRLTMFTIRPSTIVMSFPKRVPVATLTGTDS